LTPVPALRTVLPERKEMTVKATSMGLALALLLSTAAATAQQGGGPTITTEVPQQPLQPRPVCRQINKGGPIAGIVVASIFLWVLPMSIPVLITQTKKLRRRRAEIYEQRRMGCP
jgi:hypothetical protein